MDSDWKARRDRTVAQIERTKAALEREAKAERQRVSCLSPAERLEEFHQLCVSMQKFVNLLPEEKRKAALAPIPLPEESLRKLSQLRSAYRDAR